MQPAIAEATRYNRETPLQGVARGRDHSRRTRACSNRANLTTAGRSLGSQIVIRLPPSWAGHLSRPPKTKPQPPKTEHLRKKGFFNELCCSRIKHSSLTALNGTKELTAQHLRFYKGQTVSSSSSLTPVHPKSHFIKGSSG